MNLSFLGKSKKKRPALIGVVHLPPLPGSPGAHALGGTQAAINSAGSIAIREAVQLEKAGARALILENFGDAPFYGDRVPPETIAAMTLISAAVREVTRLPIGINVLRNDANAALAIASVVGAQFIRVNVLSGVYATDQGILSGKAAELHRTKMWLAPEVEILADVNVKHAQCLSKNFDDPHAIETAIEEVVGRSGAHGVILTGATTGRPVDIDEMARASSFCRKHNVPLLLGSGVTPELYGKLKASDVTGVIVGSALRIGGRAGAALDAKRVLKFAHALKA